MIVVDAPVANVARVQVTDTFPLLVHAQPGPDADPNVTPAGNVSTTLTVVASEGPRFDTANEYDTDPPATTVAGPDFTNAKFADAVTVVDTADELLPGTGSAVVEDTAAVLLNVVACAGAVTTTVIVVDAPVAYVARVHVTDTFPLFVHDQPGPDADTNVTPAGNVSVTTTPRRIRRTHIRHHQRIAHRTTSHHRRRTRLHHRQISRRRHPRRHRRGVVGRGWGRASSTRPSPSSTGCVPWAGPVTTTEMAGAVVPVASSGRVQVTDTFPAFVHDQPPPAADTNVTPAGKGVDHAQRRRRPRGRGSARPASR